MKDIGSSHLIRSQRKKAVLVPQPSTDPHDPLVRIMLSYDSVHISRVAKDRLIDVAMALELESSLETLRHSVRNARHVCADSGSVGNCTYFSRADCGFQNGLGWGRAIHRSYDLGVGL